MSRSWGSDRMRPRAGRVAALLLILLAVAPAGAWARTHRIREVTRVVPDTVRVVKRVEVGPSGIEIDGEPAERDESPRTRVRVGPTRIDVRDEGDNDNVQVDLPGVHVHTAASDSNRCTEMVRAFTDIDVTRDQVVDGGVVAVCGSVTVEGHVRGDVIAVCGSVRLKPGAVVDGSAVAIGGVLDKPEGATVGDESISLGFLPLSFGFPTLPILLLTIVVGWLLTVFMSWLLSMLFPERLQRVATTVSRNPAGSFFLGLVSLPLCVILVLLLFVTVIGLPVALLLPLFYVLVVWTGQIAASYLLGCRLLRRRPGEAALFGPAVAGSVFVALFFVAGAVLAAPQGFMMRSLALFFTLLGLLLVTGLSILGTGAFLLTKGGGRPREPKVAAPVVPATGPLPASPPIG